MANYVLLLNCSAGANGTELEGDFDSQTWASNTNSPVVTPATTSLSVNPGDQVAFAVQAASGLTLNWVCVIVSAVTAPGNRNSRNADNNSPFRFGTAGSNVAAVLLVSNTTPAVWSFTGYSAAGAPSASGPYYGTPFMSITADVAPGSSRPGRNVSQYEAVIVASCTDSSNKTWQFAFDPEMDVNNNN